MCIRDRNRILQSKVYLDEATGLPNKNKCEEILNASDLLSAQDAVAICVFDLNNLRNINNNLGHDKGDEYIRSFAVPVSYTHLSLETVLKIAVGPFLSAL